MTTPQSEHRGTAPSASAAGVVDVILRDGSTLRLHAPAAEEADDLVEFFVRLSPESRHSRFHGTVTPDRALVERFLAPDWDARGALVERSARETGGASSPSATTVACATRLSPRRRSPSPMTCGASGIGTRLLEQLAARAAPSGIRRFARPCWWTTRRCCVCSRPRGSRSRRRFAEGVIEVELELEERRVPRRRRRARPGRRRLVARAVACAQGRSPSSALRRGAAAIGGELSAT